jgi:hypothetical protein
MRGIVLKGVAREDVTASKTIATLVKYRIVGTMSEDE